MSALSIGPISTKPEYRVPQEESPRSRFPLFAGIDTPSHDSGSERTETPFSERITPSPSSPSDSLASSGSEKSSNETASSSPLVDAQEKTTRFGNEQLLGLSPTTWHHEVIRETAQASGVSLTEDEIANVAKTFHAFVEQSPRDKEAYAKKLVSNSRWIDFGEKKVWMLNEKLGAGAQGQVMLGITADGQKCAIKNNISQKQLDEITLARGQTTRGEDYYLTTLKDVAGVIKLLASNDNYIVLEYCTKDLIDAINSGELGFPELDKYTQQIINTLESIHNRGVIHGDIKGENILIDENGNLKISDFGFAVLEGETVFGGTAVYISPEQAQQAAKKTCKNLKKGDIWASMRTLAILNNNALSPEFTAFFETYKKRMTTLFEASQTRYQKMEKVLGKAKTPREEQNRKVEMLEDYASKASNQFRAWKQAGRMGLFDGLGSPNNGIETILQGLSAFNHKNRYSLKQVQEIIAQADAIGSSIYMEYASQAMVASE